MRDILTSCTGNTLHLDTAFSSNVTLILYHFCFLFSVYFLLFLSQCISPAVSMSLVATLILLLTIPYVKTLTDGNTGNGYAVTYISGSYGSDQHSCMNNETNPCQSLSYALLHLNDLNVSHPNELIIQGTAYLSTIYTVSDVDGLTIRGEGKNDSVVQCTSPLNSDGTGIVFERVTNLLLANLTVRNCAISQLISDAIRNISDFGYIRCLSAIHIEYCTNVSVESCSFIDNYGRGLSIRGTNGVVRISECLFVRNAVVQKHQRLGGGGISIDILEHCSACSPGNVITGHNNTYTISNTDFEDNIAKSLHENLVLAQFPVLPPDGGCNLGDGGGMAITIKGASVGNNISVSNCTFRNNAALYGGGLSLALQDSCEENNLTVSRCRFLGNSSPDRSGGGVIIGYMSSNVTRNVVTVYNSEFTNNSAGWAGGLHFFSSRSKQDAENHLNFINCVWNGNSATFGAAVAITPEARHGIFDGSPPTVFFQNTSFIENKILDTASFLQNSEKASQLVLQSGALHVDAFVIDIFKSIKFIRNYGSAVLANSASINILESTTAHFENNAAQNGGAISLLDFSVLQLFPNTIIIFQLNKATVFGGAIYATSSHDTEFIYSHKCFISYYTNDDPNNWQSTLIFVNNTATYGTAIYTDSLLPCAKQASEIITDVNGTFQWEGFHYTPPLEENTIATGPATVHFALPPEIAPGERIHIQPKAHDDFGQTQLVAYQAHIEGDAVYILGSPYISDGHIQIAGKPNTHFMLTLQTINSRPIASKKEGKLGNCPLSFKFQNNACSCHNEAFAGVTKCDEKNLKSYLRRGYWAGCSRNGTLITADCPAGYCLYKSYLTPLPRSCGETTENFICDENRKGRLCGECQDGYTAYFHSRRFNCGKCSYGAYGLLIYVATELLPITMFFIFLLIFQFNIISCYGDTFIFFVQMVLVINLKSSVQNKGCEFFDELFYSLVGILNLDFSLTDKGSYCLWSGAIVLDNLAFKYITALFTVVLVSTLIFLFRHCQMRLLILKLLYCTKLKRFAATKVTSPVVHSISTLLVLSYNKYTVISFQLLARSEIFGQNGSLEYSVARLSGHDYFGSTHLHYALPALIVVIFFSLPPPLLLFSYPLLWKIKAKFKFMRKLHTEQTCWPIRKLLPLIDSFQGNLKDNMRFFSGLFFLWRLIIAAIVSFSDSVDLYLFLQLALIVMLLIHAISQPNQRQLHNIADIATFTLLLMINSLNWFLYSSMYDNTQGSMVHLAAIVKILLIYLPVILIPVVLFTKKVPAHMRHRIGSKWRMWVQPKHKDKSLKKGIELLPTSENVLADEQLFNRVEESSYSSSYIYMMDND